MALVGRPGQGPQRLALDDWLAVWMPSERPALHLLLQTSAEDEWSQRVLLARHGAPAPGQARCLQLRGLVERDALGGLVRVSGSIWAAPGPRSSGGLRGQAPSAPMQDDLHNMARLTTIGQFLPPLDAARSVEGLGVARLDLLDGSVHSNANLCAIVGLPFAPQGRPRHEWQAVIHPDDRRLAQADLRRLLAGRQAAAVAFRVLHADGGVRCLSGRQALQRDANGKASSITLVVLDVTEQQQRQTARQARLLAGQANRATSEFLARVSHELRTPLNAILGFAEILEADCSPALSDGQRKRVERIRAAGGHLLELINDLLDVSRIETGVLRLQLSPVDFLVEVREALCVAQSHASARQVILDFDLSGSPDGFWVYGDHTRLRQVALNLLTNAIKYNRPRGRVAVSLTRDAEHVVLRVKDTGLGMNTQQLSSLFQPFNRLGKEHSTIDGAGIGLVIAKHLVELMGGVVHVSSQSRLGTEFCVRLRSVEPSGVRRESSPLPKREAVQAGFAARLGRVLCIEDHAVNRALVEGYVSLRPGIELQLAVDGESGIAAAKRDVPDLILIDMMLPDLHGLQVIQRLRAVDALKLVRCVAVSANAMPQQIKDAAAAGFDGYLTKPLSLQSFLAELDRLV